MGRCHHAKARLLGRLPRMWGCSSDGRALQSHCRGQEFDPPQLHHLSALINKRNLDYAAKGSIWAVSFLYRTWAVVIFASASK